MSSIPPSAMVLIIISSAAAFVVIGYAIHRMLAPDSFEERSPHNYPVEQQEYMRDVAHRNWEHIMGMLDPLGVFLAL